MEEDKKPDWGRFVVKLPINELPEKIIQNWLTQENLENWFLRKAEFTSPSGEIRKRTEKIQPGDSYKWQWHGWPESIEETGKILSPENGEFLRFVFGKAGIVSVSIVIEHNHTILQLVQDEIPLDEISKMNFHVGCKTGWTFYMLNLKSMLLDGPDLRNKDSKLHMD